MGHSIRGIGLAPAARALSKWVPVVTLDGALANMAKEAPRRLIIKIDAEGFEPNVIVGAQALLAAGRVALIIWERGPAFAEGLGRTAMIQMTALLSDCGFRHFLPAGGHLGAPFAFDPQADYIGNVFSVGPQLHRRSDLRCRRGVNRYSPAFMDVARSAGLFGQGFRRIALPIQKSVCTAGTTTSKRSGPTSIPPTTTVARGRCTWLPIPVEIAAGSKPIQADKAVINIGRIRCEAA